ncbi:MAG: acyl-CoA carboxylase epsilon subunit [Acidimicrobiia bacterium]
MRAKLRAISPDASPEEVAAIVTALASLQLGVVEPIEPVARSRWLDASRRSARRVGVSRGDWRLAGRIVRRARA